MFTLQWEFVTGKLSLLKEMPIFVSSSNKGATKDTFFISSAAIHGCVAAEIPLCAAAEAEYCGPLVIVESGSAGAAQSTHCSLLNSGLGLSEHQNPNVSL